MNTVVEAKPNNGIQPSARSEFLNVPSVYGAHRLMPGVRRLNVLLFGNVLLITACNTCINMKKVYRYSFQAIAVVLLVIAAVLAWYKLWEEPRRREAVLRQNLREMRMLLSQYMEDNQQLPESLSDLVRRGYMVDIPVDPIRQTREWLVVIGHDAVGGVGVIDVRSSADGRGTDGLLYSQY